MTRICTNKPLISPTLPLSIVTSKSANFFYSGDIGVTMSSGVSSWEDQSGNVRNATQITSGNQPSYNYIGLNGRGVITFDGIDDYLLNSFIAPAPGTTPGWYWLVFNPKANVTGQTIFAAGASNRFRFYWNNTTQIIMHNNFAVNQSSVTANQWYRGEVSFTNSTNDYRKIGNNNITGSNSGNNTGSGGFFLATSSAGGGWGNVSIACFGSWNGEPTSGEKAALDSWVTSYYGGTVLI